MSHEYNSFNKIRTGYFKVLQFKNELVVELFQVVVLNFSVSASQRVMMIKVESFFFNFLKTSKFLESNIIWRSADHSVQNWYLYKNLCGEPV